jgi:hypothetical protein
MRALIAMIGNTLTLVMRFLDWRKSPKHQQDLNEKAVASGDADKLNKRLDELSNTN